MKQVMAMKPYKVSSNRVFLYFLKTDEGIKTIQGFPFT
jgi:hypothetical protein